MNATPWFRNVNEVSDRLVAWFPKQDLGNKRNPFDELLYIILSAKTPPERYRRAYAELHRHYPRFNDLAEANRKELSEVIHFAGLADRKSTQIVDIAQQLKAEFGTVSLAPLRQMSIEEAERFLTSLSGIGLKSARCILLYSLDFQVFPADNHCLRIAKRLNWISDASFSKHIANKLQDGIPPHLRRDLHVNMVLLGRERCFQRSPVCNGCPIFDYCPTGQSQIGMETLY